jgi:hypothetical protein
VQVPSTHSSQGLSCWRACCRCSSPEGEKVEIISLRRLQWEPRAPCLHPGFSRSSWDIKPLPSNLQGSLGS